MVLLEARNADPVERRATLARGAHVTLEATLQVESQSIAASPWLWLGVALIVVAGAATAIGFALNPLSNTHASDPIFGEIVALRVP